MEKKSNSLLLDFSEQIRAVEALLFASSDPLDEKTLKEMLPVARTTGFPPPFLGSPEGPSMVPRIAICCSSPNEPKLIDPLSKPKLDQISSH